jgi:L-lactate dehydrogenase
MAAEGDPEVISDRGACVAWDGKRMSGPWLVSQATDLAIERARRYGTCSIVIARTHHIACLAAFLRRATDQGLMMLVMSADPCNDNVAPHGGKVGVVSPNPIAAGIPTQGEPILIDVSTSITTNGMTQRLQAEGKRFPGEWLVDADGHITDDPNVMSAQPKGALLPLGGLQSGHKGYALSLLVEALTNGLSGHGRMKPREGWGGTAFIEVFDPDAFGGGSEFLRETTHLARLCRSSAPRDPAQPVRLPGEAAAQRKARQLRAGVALYPTILAAIRPWAEKFAIALPQPLP